MSVAGRMLCWIERMLHVIGRHTWLVPREEFGHDNFQCAYCAKQKLNEGWGVR